MGTIQPFQLKATTQAGMSSQAIGILAGLSSLVPSSTRTNNVLSLSTPTLPRAEPGGIPGPSHESHPNVDTTSSTQVSTLEGPSYLALSSTSASGMLSFKLSTPTFPDLEPDGIHAHHRPTKHKKFDEVNTADILPDGLQ